MHGQGDLGKLGAHPQQGRAPHPEHRTRAADGDGTRYARDVAGAHGAGQRRAHGLEGGHGTIGSVLFVEHPANGGLDGVGKFADLQKARAHAEQQAHADDAHHGGNAPDKVVDRLIDGGNGFNHNSSHILCKISQSGTFCQKHTKFIVPYFGRSVKQNFQTRGARRRGQQTKTGGSIRTLLFGNQVTSLCLRRPGLLPACARPARRT